MKSTIFIRPSTRGELRDRLRTGESCEVARFAAEMTSIMLKGWLDMEDFTLEDSPNPGWVIFKPKIS